MVSNEAMIRSLKSLIYLKGKQNITDVEMVEVEEQAQAPINKNEGH